MNDSVEGSEITEIGAGEFAYSYYNYRPEMLAFFESKGLQGGGYTWEALGKAGLALGGAKLAGLVQFNPEGDGLFAESSSRAALEELKSIVERIARDAAFREQCIALAAKRGELE
jgi:hypothetical protein